MATSEPKSESNDDALPMLTLAASDLEVPAGASLQIVVPTHAAGAHLHLAYAENAQGDIRVEIADQHGHTLYDELNTKGEVALAVHNSEFCTLKWDNSAAWMSAASVSYTVKVLSEKRAREAEAGRAQGRLLAAAALGELDVIAELAAASTSLEATDGEGLTPLLLSVLRRQEGALALLINTGASTDARDRHGNSALHLAALSGFSSAVRRLLKADTRLCEALNANGATPLHLASFGGHAPVVEQLLSSRAAVSAVDARGSTALHYAASAGHDHVARLLLEAGASPLALDAHDESPLCRAASASHLRALESILEACGSVSDDDGQPASVAPDAGLIRSVVARALGIALAAGDDAISLALLESRVLAAEDATSRLQTTADAVLGRLCVRACGSGSAVAAVRLLSVASADGSRGALSADGGAEALLAAARNDHAEIVALLVRSGAADKGPTTSEGGAGPALLAAVAAHHSAVVLELLADRADSEAARECLTAAAAVGDTGLSTMLLAAGVSGDAPSNGIPAIHAAAAAGHTLTAMALLRHRCSPLLRDGDGRTALQRAISEGEESTALALLRGMEPQEQLELCR